MGVGLVAARGSGTSQGSPINHYYTSLSGTSMATPMTSGVVALMLQKNPSLTPAQVKYILKKTAKPLDDQATPNHYWGWGRVEAKYAIDNATYSSLFESDSLPVSPCTILISTSSISITIENDGSYGWSNANNVTLHALSDAADIGDRIIQIPDDINVMPDQQYTWPVRLNTSVVPATYQLRYQLFSNDTPFGDTFSKVVRFNSSIEPGIFEFNNSSQNASKSDGKAVIRVDRFDGMDNAVTVNYSVSGGNAMPHIDYLPANGTLAFIQDQDHAFISVTLLNNGTYVGVRTVNVTLSNATGGATVDNGSSVVFISDTFINYTYHLSNGWNLISVPLDISNNSIDGFFPADVKGGIVDVWGWNETKQDFMFYSLNKNDWYYSQYEPLNTIETGRAYWVEMNKTASFTVNGTMPSDLSSSSKALVKGWNFRGVLGLSSSYYVESLYKNPINVWGWNETKQDFMFYSLNKNDWYYSQYQPLTMINSGKGYWVEMP
jgi:hypothetical protein